MENKGILLGNIRVAAKGRERFLCIGTAGGSVQPQTQRAHNLQHGRKLAVAVGDNAVFLS